MSAGYRPRCTRQHPGRAEVIVSVARLEELERKERAHDDYLVGIKRVHDTYTRNRMSGAIDQPHGYEQALIDLDEAIIAAMRQRMD